VELGFKLRAPCFQSRYSTPGGIPPAHFAVVILEMESPKLFARAGLEPANPPDLILLSNYDYRHEPQAPGVLSPFLYDS
jgi:hypothetical protein